MTKDLSNFGQNLALHPKAIFSPHNVAELLEVLSRHQGQEIRAIGSLHSWSAAPATTGVMLDLRHLNSVEITQDGDATWVTVGAGCKLKRLVQQLAAQGLTLPTLGLIDEQTVAGATATGTHGSGRHSLSHYVEGVSIAHYDKLSGDTKITVIEAGQDLQAARCSLGLLGVIVSTKIRCRRCYNIEEHAQRHSSLDSVLSQESDYPLQQFFLMPWSWQYFGQHRVETGSPRNRSASLYRIYCFCVLDVSLHIAVSCLAKLIRMNWPIRFFYQRILPLVIVRNWKVVDDSHAMLIMEHELFRHIEVEIFVQRDEIEGATQLLIDVISAFGGRALQHPQSTEALLRKIEQWDRLGRSRGAYVHHYPICFRRVLPDDLLFRWPVLDREPTKTGTPSA